MSSLEWESEEKKKAFNELYKKYYEYIYKYEVRHPKDFKPDTWPIYKDDFFLELVEEGMRIKVVEGY